MEQLSPAPGPFTERFLSDHRVVALSGRDAVAFAQAQFMSDAKSLAAGHWQWSGWLTPKGRVIVLFALLKLDDENVWVVLQDADPAEFAARLQRFVFRSKLSISVRDDLQANGSFAVGSAQGAVLTVADDVVALDLSGAGGPRTLRLASTASSGIENNDADALARWAAFDLMHGWPRLSPAQSEQWTPQQLSLDRLRAYSVKKGCYPGQEIVARTHFLGQAKRGLALFDSDAAIAPGAQIDDGGRTQGTVVSAVPFEGRHLALGVLPLEIFHTGLHANGVPLHFRALSDGLAR